MSHFSCLLNFANQITIVSFNVFLWRFNILARKRIHVSGACNQRCTVSAVSLFVKQVITENSSPCIPHHWYRAGTLQYEEKPFQIPRETTWDPGVRWRLEQCVTPPSVPWLSWIPDIFHTTWWQPPLFRFKPTDVPSPTSHCSPVYIPRDSVHLACLNPQLFVVVPSMDFKAMNVFPYTAATLTHQAFEVSPWPAGSRIKLEAKSSARI